MREFFHRNAERGDVISLVVVVVVVVVVIIINSQFYPLIIITPVPMPLIAGLPYVIYCPAVAGPDPSFLRQCLILALDHH